MVVIHTFSLFNINKGLKEQREDKEGHFQEMVKFEMEAQMYLAV